nr:amyloid beta A4 protein [Hymenolepis microstoma]
MEENYFGHNSRQSQFSKFVDEIPPDDLVEISLSSDGEHDVDEFSNDTKHSPINTQPIFPSNSASQTVIQDFFEPPFSPSIISHNTNSTQYFQDSNYDDIDDDLKFNEDLANSIRHQCSLFSPSLVRAINSDIKEIKRSLNASKGGEKLPSKPNPNVEHDRLVKCHRRGLNGNQRKSLNPSSRSFYVKRGLNQTKAKMIKSNGNKKDEMTVRQWNFSAPSNAAYSTSSESEGANSTGGSTPTNSDPEASPRISKSPVNKISSRDQTQEEEEEEDGQWSLQRRPPCPPKNQSSRPLSAESGSDVICAGASRSNSTNSTSKSLQTQRTKKPQSNLEPDYGSDEDTDQLLDKQYRCDKPVDIPELKEEAEFLSVKKRRGREVAVHHPSFPDRLIEGHLYRSRYLGSTQLICEDHPSKVNRLHQAQEAVQRVKAPDGESQPSVPVELFVSTECVLILNKDLDEIVMDHDLRTISYIADVGSILVLMVRRPHPAAPPKNAAAVNNTDNSPTPSTSTATPSDEFPDADRPLPPAKIICHLFESDETQMITQAIGKAFQEAYFEFLRQNGIEDPEAFQERNFQNMMHQQEIFRNELAFFSDKDQEKEVIIPKSKGEALGVVIVESGWGSVLPTAVLANMHPSGPAARCGQLNIGNRIISINGQSLVGLPLSTCQSYFKATKNQTAVKLVIVNCSPVVEVLIRRPDQKFQLGFSVQDGVICSLLRGGIAERGGIRVDHRIIEINGESVVAVPHEYIVNLLATAVGEIYIRTMPTSIFRLLTGQETPHYI